MNEMVRDSIGALAMEGSLRNMSYGQYVAARFYPVEIVQFAPDGGKIVRSAPMPPAVKSREAEVARRHRRTGDGPVRSSRPRKEKPARKCVVCGKELGPYQRKYCGAVCNARAQETRGRDDKNEKKAVREDRPCSVCGSMMMNAAKNKKYCGPECRRIAERKYMAQWKRDHREERTVRKCVLCGEPLTGNRMKYCESCSRAEAAARRRQRYLRRCAERSMDE